MIKSAMIYNQINEILTDWNPIGVDLHIARDEYRGYIPIIIYNISNEEALMSTLENILINELGLEYDSKDTSQYYSLKKILIKLISVVRQS